MTVLIVGALQVDYFFAESFRKNFIIIIKLFFNSSNCCCRSYKSYSDHAGDLNAIILQQISFCKYSLISVQFKAIWEISVMVPTVYCTFSSISSSFFLYRYLNKFFQLFMPTLLHGPRYNIFFHFIRHVGLHQLSWSVWMIFLTPPSTLGSHWNHSWLYSLGSPSRHLQLLVIIHPLQLWWMLLHLQ